MVISEPTVKCLFYGISETPPFIFKSKRLKTEVTQCHH